MYILYCKITSITEIKSTKFINRSAQLFLTDVWSIFWQNKNLVFPYFFITKTLYFLVVFYKNVFLKQSDSITKQSYYRGRQVFTTKINNVQKSIKSPRLTSNFSFFWFLCLEVQPTSVSDVCVLRFLPSSFFRPNISQCFWPSSDSSPFFSV